MQSNPSQDKTDGALASLNLIDTLDALSASIAIVDYQGRIRSVNRAWRQFAAENSTGNPDGWVGANYLDVCDAVVGEDRAAARAFADALRSVQQGQLDSFQLEYPCHSAEKQRWFIGRITPLPVEGKSGH